MDLRPAVIALTLAAAFVAAPTHPAAPPEQRVSVTMSTFRFNPDEIKLVHGQPYALEVTNSSGESHNFVATGFFASARMSPGERHRLAGDRIELKPGESVTIHLVAPPKGRYDFRCSHRSHVPMGMSGMIKVI